MPLLAGKAARSFPALTRADIGSRARGRIASHVRANTASYTREGNLMPRVIVTTAIDVGKPRIGGTVHMDEEVDLIHLDSHHHAPQFLERMVTAVEGAHRAEARSARQQVG